MGLFDWRKKKNNNSNTTEDIDKKYEESMAYFAKEEAERAKRIKEDEDINNEITGRIAQLENAPGVRRANDVATEMAKEIAKKIKFSKENNPSEQNYQQVVKPKQTNINMINNQKKIVEAPEDKRTAEEIIDTELAKLKEKGLPDKTIEKFRQSDLDYIKAKRGIASEKEIKSRLIEVYDRFKNPQVLNAYKLSAEEYLKNIVKSLIEHGISEEEIQRFYQNKLKEIANNRKLYNERQINIPEWSTNQHIYFESLRIIDQLNKISDEQESHKKR